MKVKLTRIEIVNYKSCQLLVIYYPDKALTLFTPRRLSRLFIFPIRPEKAEKRFKKELFLIVSCAPFLGRIRWASINSPYVGVLAQIGWRP